MLKLIILGIVQGLTEFLPVSSSGHLVIFQELLNIKENQLALDVVLHFGTLLSLLVFFFKDILKIFQGFVAAIFSLQKNTLESIWRESVNFRLAVHIFLITFITGIIAITGKDFFESLFTSIRLVALSLLVTGFILFKTRKYSKGTRGTKDFNLRDALIFGLAQGFAIIPGISRSGITISTLLFRGLKREEAFRISFLASMPAIGGAFLLCLKDLNQVSQQFNLIFVILGFLVSFLVGLLALRILKGALKSFSLAGFGYYCFMVALIILLMKR